MLDIFFILKALLLALIEALTEFLPVSSTGHLLLFSHALSFEQGDFSILFSVLVQLAAILAVCVHYRKVFLSKIQNFQQNKNFFYHLLIASLPAFVLGFLFDDFIETHFMSVYSVAFWLLVGALLLLWFEKKKMPLAKTDCLEKMTLRQALCMGCFQCLALMPGFSRSASTLMGGWQAGLQTSLALDFSFFMAVPVMFGASFYSLLKFFIKRQSFFFQPTEAWALGLSFLLSFFLSWIVIRLFLQFVKKKPLRYFAYYRILLAIFLFLVIRKA